jgi:hypothetical protein
MNGTGLTFLEPNRPSHIQLNPNQTHPPNLTPTQLQHLYPTQLRNTDRNQQQEHEDMEIQTEKKRRREEEALQHFLTAGPGSQDCRDQ